MNARGLSLGLSGLLTAMGLSGLAGCDPQESKLGQLIDSEPDTCELPDQSQWVYDTMLEAYLWNDELPDDTQFDPLSFETPEDTLRALRVELDRWSRINDKTTSDALFMEGLTLAFGIGTAVTQDAGGADQVQVRYTDIDSPAAMAGLKRGDVILTVDGVDALNADWGPREEGVTRTVVYMPREMIGVPDATPVEVTMTKDWYKIITVPQHNVIDVDGEPVGYVMFTSHLDPSKDELNAAFADFQAAGVTKLIVDLRYNGGGLVAVSRYMMHLIGGATHEGKVAYKVVYNDNLAESNSTREFAKLEHSIPVERVAFITTGGTASASELTINAMLPHVDTMLVGTTTSGKPVGMNRFEFCEKLLWPITFKFVNADDNADYFEGFSPDCPSSDDLMYDYGDENEAMIATAIDAVMDGQCTQGYSPTFPIREGQLHDPIEDTEIPFFPGAVVQDLTAP